MHKNKSHVGNQHIKKPWHAKGNWIPDKLQQFICILPHTLGIIENTVSPKLKKKDNKDAVQKNVLIVILSTDLLPLQGNAGELFPLKGTPEAEHRSSSLSASKMKCVSETP